MEGGWKSRQENSVKVFHQELHSINDGIQTVVCLMLKLFETDTNEAYFNKQIETVECGQ